jgi:hypothetical protein
MGAAATGPFAEVAPGQIVVVAAPHESTRLDRLAEGTERLKRRNRDLHVDDRLGGQTGNRGRTDVIDAQRNSAERGPQIAPERGEQLRPSRVVNRSRRAHRLQTRRDPCMPYQKALISYIRIA